MEGVPKQLAKLDETGRLTVDRGTLELLESCQEKVTVVGIVGTYRSGKSSLMNLLAYSLNGFETSDDMDGKTQGIWVMLVKHPKREDEKLLFIDTEGFSDAMRTNNDSEKICIMFCLLVCDILIVNVTKVIDKSILEILGALSDIAGLATLEWEKYFPHLVVTVRDSSLKCKIKGNKVTPKQLLENILNRADGDSSQNKEYNRTRDVIRQYFKNRDCFKFGLPFDPDISEGEECMKDENNLRAPFKKTLDELRTLVYGCKHIGEEMTGQGFASRIPIYIENLQDTTKKLDIPNVYQQTEDAVKSEMISEATAYYQDALEKDPDCKIFTQFFKAARLHKNKTKHIYLAKKSSAHQELNTELNKIKLYMLEKCTEDFTRAEKAKILEAGLVTLKRTNLLTLIPSGAATWAMGVLAPRSIPVLVAGAVGIASAHSATNITSYAVSKKNAVEELEIEMEQLPPITEEDVDLDGEVGVLIKREVEALLPPEPEWAVTQQAELGQCVEGASCMGKLEQGVLIEREVEALLPPEPEEAVKQQTEGGSYEEGTGFIGELEQGVEVVVNGMENLFLRDQAEAATQQPEKETYNDRTRLLDQMEQVEILSSEEDAFFTCRDADLKLVYRHTPEMTSTRSTDED